MSDSLLFFATLSCAVFGVDWLTGNTRLRYLGSALGSLIAGAVLVNAGLLPAPMSDRALYSGTLSVVAPLSIFYLIVQVDLHDLRRAGGPMLLAFALAAPGAVLGAWLGYLGFLAGTDMAVTPAVVTGMITAGHVGGSANFNAIAVHYDAIASANVFVTVLAVDHVFIALWIGITILIPRRAAAAARASAAGDSAPTPPATPGNAPGNAPGSTPPVLSVGGIALYISAGLAALWLSQGISAAAARHGVTLPLILLITVLGLVVGHIRAFRRRAGYDVFGNFLVCVFLLCVGAYTDLRVLLEQRELAAAMAGMLTVTLAVHALAVFGIGRALKVDWAVLAVGSQASIGGPVSAGALAEAIDRSDLVLPAVLVGSLGGALGTFTGFAVVAFLT